nr:MAG TPA: hypothetical protein [Caudoviricetes sp.]
MAIVGVLGCGESDGGRRGNGDVHVHHFIHAAAHGVHGQLTVKGKLAVRAIGSDHTGALRAAKPNCITGFLAFESLESLEVRQCVVRGEGQAVKRLDASDVSLHIITQSGGFQHFGFAAEVGKFLDVDQLAPSIAGITFLHQKGFIGRNSHFHLPPVKSSSICFGFVPSHQTVDCCVLQIGNGGQRNTPEIFGVHEIVHKPHNLSANRFLAACLIGVDIHLIHQRSEPLRISAVHVIFRGVVILLHQAHIGETGRSIDILAADQDTGKLRSQGFHNRSVDLTLHINHENTSFAISVSRSCSSFTVSYIGILAGLPWVMTTNPPFFFSFSTPFVPGSP